MTKMKLLLGTAAITKAIASINSRGKKLDNSIQQAAVSIINDIELHGDVTIATKLIHALPKGSRSNALKAFLETFGKVQWSNKENAFAYLKTGTTDLDGAQAIMWTEFKPEQPYTAADIGVTLAKLVKKIHKDAEHGIKHDETQVKLVEELNAKLNPETADA